MKRSRIAFILCTLDLVLHLIIKLIFPDIHRVEHYTTIYIIPFFYFVTFFYVWLYIKYTLLTLFNFKWSNNFIITYLGIETIWFMLHYLAYYFHSFYIQIFIPFMTPIFIVRMFTSLLLGISILRLRDSHIRILRYYCYSMMIVAPLATIFVYTDWIFFVNEAHKLLLVAALFQFDGIDFANNKNHDLRNPQSI